METFLDEIQSSLNKQHINDNASSLTTLNKEEKKVTFSDVYIFYFSRCQGFCSVPQKGGCTLGMSFKHSHFEQFNCDEYTHLRNSFKLATLEKNQQKYILRHSLRNNAKSINLKPAIDISSFVDSQIENNTTVVCPLFNKMKMFKESLNIDDTRHVIPENLNFFNQNICQLDFLPKALTLHQRISILKASGVKEIDPIENFECQKIRSSRQACGCKCRLQCLPNICSCIIAGVGCQVDRLQFPCTCSSENCKNMFGRQEFNFQLVHNNRIEQIKRHGGRIKSGSINSLTPVKFPIKNINATEFILCPRFLANNCIEPVENVSDQKEGEDISVKSVDSIIKYPYLESVNCFHGDIDIQNKKPNELNISKRVAHNIKLEVASIFKQIKNIRYLVDYEDEDSGLVHIDFPPENLYNNDVAVNIPQSFEGNPINIESNTISVNALPDLLYQNILNKYFNEKKNEIIKKQSNKNVCLNYEIQKEQNFKYIFTNSAEKEEISIALDNPNLYMQDRFIFTNDFFKINDISAFKHYFPESNKCLLKHDILNNLDSIYKNTKYIEEKNPIFDEEFNKMCDDICASTDTSFNKCEEEDFTHIVTFNKRKAKDNLISSQLEQFLFVPTNYVDISQLSAINKNLSIANLSFCPSESDENNILSEKNAILLNISDANDKQKISKRFKNEKKLTLYSRLDKLEEKRKKKCNLANMTCKQITNKSLNQLLKLRPRKSKELNTNFKNINTINIKDASSNFCSEIISSINCNS